MRDRQTCIDCGKKSPETETNYTLISAQFGWRLSRRRAENGEFVVEWRCPDCWRNHKKKTDEPGSGTQGKTIPDGPPGAKAIPERSGTLPSATRAPAAKSSRPPAAPTRPSKPPSSAPANPASRPRRP